MTSLDLPSARRLHPIATRASDWDTAFDALCAFTAEHGHACPPAGYRTPGGIGLGRWVAAQRHRHKTGRLTDGQVQQLEELKGRSYRIRLPALEFRVPAACQLGGSTYGTPPALGSNSGLLGAM